MSRRVLLSVLLAIATTAAVPGGVSDAQPGARAQRAPAAAAEPVPTGPDRLAYSLAVDDDPPGGQGYGVRTAGLGSMAFDGTDRRVLVDDSAGQSYDPQWSPDGRWLTYTNWPTGAHRPRVMAIPRDGGEPQQIADYADGITWSPDGLRLAWMDETTGDTSNRLMTAPVVDVGTQLVVGPATPIYASDRGISEPHFSPDGLLIAFSEGTRDVDADVMVMPSAGGEPMQVTHHIPMSDDMGNTIQWSPDGTRLLVVASTVIDGDRMPEPYLVDVDGQNQHMVWKPRSRTYTFSTTWSPDGSEVALTDNSFWDGLQIYGVDGSLHTVIAGGRRVDWQGPIAYTPDGTKVLAVADVGEHTTNGAPGAPPELWAMPVNGDPIEQVTHDHSVFPSTLQTVDPGAALREVGVGQVAAAVTVSRAAFHRAGVVLVVPRHTPAAALAAAPAAAHWHAPVLLTGRRLQHSVAKEIHRLRAHYAVVVGSVPGAVVAALRGKGLAVVRRGASDNPYAVAAAVTRQLTAKSAVLAVAPKARGSLRAPLAAAGYAGVRGLPMLYTRPHRLPVPTARALRAHGTSRVILVADETDDTERVVGALQRRGIQVRRVGGSAYRISARLATMAHRRGAHLNHVFMTSGRSLTVPAAAGARGVVSILVARGDLRRSVATRHWLAARRHAITTSQLVGSPREVRPRVEVQVERIL